MLSTSRFMEFLQIIVPQGTPEEPKKEKYFLQFLVNLHKTAGNNQLSFEIFAYRQYAYLYIACPSEISKLIEGQLYSTFPDAEIRRGKDYTEMINPKTQAIAGANLHFKMSDIYPMLDYTNFEVDSLSSLFSVISKFGKDDQGWVQILVKPIQNDWKYQLGRQIRQKLNNFYRRFRLKNFFRIKGKKEHFKEEDGTIIAKSELSPFQVEIRVAAITEERESARNNLQALAKAFYQFNKTDYNGFEMGGIREGNSMIREYRRRKALKPSLINSKELTTLFHLPNTDHVSHVVHVLAKKHGAPKDLPTQESSDVSLFGLTNYHNNFQKFGITREDRRRHLYIVGKSGTGKSKMLELLIQSDIKEGKGIAVLDPHGDLVDNILSMIPEERKKDVILFDPSDTDFPIAFNPLEKVDEKFKMQITIGFIDIFKKLFGSNWTSRLEHVLRYTTLALLDSPNTSILSILKMLTDKTYRQTIVSRIQDSVVKNFWVNEFAGWSEKFDSEAITPLLNKVGQLVSTNMIRNIIGQPKNSFNIREIMDNGKILLMKVSKGLLGEENAQLIGSMIITKIYQAAMARADIKAENRRDFYFYVDEFQNFATDTFSEILSEARKYRLCLTIAHQYVGQLSEEIRKTVFGNVGSMVSFRVGAEDASILAQEYTPIFNIRDIINLGVREFYLKMSINGELTEAFSGRTLDIASIEKDFTKEIITESRKTFCTPKESVETMLKKWDEGKPLTDEQISIDSSASNPLFADRVVEFEAPLF